MKRIKTKEEFNGKSPVYWNSSMDYLYGKILPEDFNGSVDKWSINKANIVDCTPYKDIPLDVKEGDRFMIVSDKRMKGEGTCVTVDDKYKIGSIVYLNRQDNSKSPGFGLTPRGDYVYINWGCLAPYPTVIMKSNTKFKVGDKVNIKGSGPSGRNPKGFTIVTMDADGKRMTIYSKEWDDKKEGHDGQKRSLGNLENSYRGHWNVDENEIELADSVTTATIASLSISERYPDEERPYELVGSKHVVVISDGDFEVGEIITLTDNDGSTCPEFTNGEITTYCDWKQLAPAPYDASYVSSLSVRYPDKARPDEKIGTKHIVMEGSTFRTGEVLTLIHNDKTKNPSFSNGSEEHYISWALLAPYQGEVKPVDSNTPFEDKPYPDEKVGTKYKLIHSSGSGFKSGTILTLVYNDKSACPKFESLGKTEYLMWTRMARIESETINLNLNTQQNGSKISTTTDFAPESFLCTVSATYSTGSSPVGVAVCYSREEILLGS